METNEQNNEPAFPSKEIDYSESAESGKTVYHDQHFGMTLRDYFAAKAMQSLISDMGIVRILNESENNMLNETVKASYKVADAMLEEKNNRQ